MSVLPVGFGSAVASGYQIERSLRFNSADTAYLNRTLSSSGDMKVFTLSFWLKRTALGVINNLFTARNAIGSGAEYFQIKYNANDTISVIGRDSGSVVRCNVSSTAVFRDPGAWAHIVISFNASSTTLNVYANNVVIANSTSIGNVNYGWNNSSLTYHRIGDGALLGEANLNGYMAELYHVDGQALTPASFGQTNASTGVWEPIAYSGTYGTNGFFLKFADNSNTTAATLGKDSSGLGNNWTPNGFSVTAGSGNDSLVDTPTSYGTDTGIGGEVRGNYCTMNPLQYSSTYVTLNNGNLNVTGSSGADAGGAFGTAKVNSGKWYWEATIVAVSGTYPFIGFGVNTTGTQFQGGARIGTAGTPAIVSPESFIALNGSPSGTSFTTNDILQFALDMDNGKMWIGKNGTWMNSGVPASGTGNMFSISDRTQFVSPYIFSYNSSQVAYNFGQRAFSYTAPSGFKSFCTQNLPTPTIGATSTTQANDYFNTVIYTGTAPSTQAVTGVGFQPDFVWVKSRSLGVGSLVYDAVRGAGSSKALQSNSTDPEGLGVNVTAASSRGYISSFDSDGFTAADGTTSGQYSKANTSTYVSWNWKANGAGSSNTDGQITSTVSANNDAGFSIVTYTGNGSANQTVGHGCKVGGVATAPVFGILKDRDTNSNNNQWQIFHTAAGDKYGYFTTAAFAGTAEFYPTSGSSTTVTIARGSPAATTNESGDRYVMYLFAPVAGYSAFGSYVGNAAADGPFIYTGFRPEYVMIKASTASGDWVIEDTMRSPYNVSTNYVTANSFAAETTGQLIDFLSNGFKIRVAVSSAINGSGTTCIYAAFAENPFKYSLAR